MRFSRIYRYHDGHDHHHGHHHHHDEPPLDLSNDPAQQSLANALRASFNVLRVVMIMLLIAYALTGFMSVSQGEQGLIVRFGKLVEQEDKSFVVRPGTQFALPEPFDEKIHIPGKIQTYETRSFVFERKPEDIGKPLSEVLPVNGTLRPDRDGAMLTGDQNLSHALWRVEYRVEDADAFVRNIVGAESVAELKRSSSGNDESNYEKIIARFLDQAIVRTVATRRVEEVAGAGKSIVGDEVRRRLQEMLRKHQTGIVVDKVVGEVVYPFQVRDAFNAVTNEENNAKKAKETALQQAAGILTAAAGPNYAVLKSAIEEYGAAQSVGESEAKLSELRGKIDVLLDKAEGDVARILNQAGSRAAETRQAAERELAQFKSWLEEYHRDPLIVTSRIWNEVRGQILPNLQNELFFLPSQGDIELWSNRDLAKDIERERDATKRKLEGAGGGR